MFHGIIKFHGLNLFTVKQTKFVYQAQSLGFKLIKLQIMSWNGYPFFTSNSIIKQLKRSLKKLEKEKNDREIIWVRLL